MSGDFKEKVYDREFVTESNIFDEISEITGIDRTNLQKMVFDGKIVPVIVLNKSRFRAYNGGSVNFTNHGHFHVATCNVESFDYLNEYNTTNSRYMPVSRLGTYYVKLEIEYSLAAAALMDFKIMLQPDNICISQNRIVNAPIGTNRASCEGIYDLIRYKSYITNVYFEPQIYDIAAGNSYVARFSGYKI